MPWKECHVVEERLRFIARLLDGEKMAGLCREFCQGRSKTRPRWRRKTRPVGSSPLRIRSVRKCYLCLRNDLLPMSPVWTEVLTVNPERLEPLHLVGLGGEPSKRRPVDDVIEREQAPHQHLRRGVLPATVPHVGDTKRPIDGLAGEQHGARAAGEDGPVVLAGEPLLDEVAKETARGLGSTWAARGVIPSPARGRRASR